MSYFYISLASSLLAVLGYAPEIVNLSSSIIYKKPYNEFNSTIIWMIWISSSLLGVTYSYFIQDYYIMTSYSLTAVLNITVCTLRYYNFRPKKNTLSYCVEDGITCGIMKKKEIITNNHMQHEIIYEVDNPLNDQDIYRKIEDGDGDGDVNYGVKQNNSF